MMMKCPDLFPTIGRRTVRVTTRTLSGDSLSLAPAARAPPNCDNPIGRLPREGSDKVIRNLHVHKVPGQAYPHARVRRSGGGDSLMRVASSLVSEAF
jgi:hypothetical protein